VALIKSISGIRGTIGGRTGENLTPLDVVRFTAAFGSWLREKSANRKIVVGRDGRISGQMVQQLVVSTLTGLGFNVVDLGLSTTPTVEIAVSGEQAAGGIILTASHNPREWNALKLLNEKGEFISADDGAQVLQKAEKEDFQFVTVEKLGTSTANNSYLQKHINAIVAYPLVEVERIRAKGYRVVIDVINSTGALFIPPLLKAL
jgi:phosphomannomutase